MTGPGGMGPLMPLLDNAAQEFVDMIISMDPLSYWKLDGDHADTLKDFGSLGIDLTNDVVTPVPLAVAAGPDAFYPDTTLTGSALVASDHDSYTPATHNGLTFICLMKSDGTGTGYRRFIGKQQSSGGGEYEIQHRDDTMGLKADLYHTTGSSRGSEQTTAVEGARWNVVSARIHSDGQYPRLRANGVNLGASTLTSNAGSVVNTDRALRLFGHGGETGRFKGAMAHVAVYAGILTDEQIAAYETAAYNAGWAWKYSSATFSGGLEFESDGWKYHVITADTTFDMVVPGLVEVFVIGGGGGGGVYTAATTNAAGGGGAGGLNQRGIYVDSDTAVTIGAGGAPQPNSTTFAVAGSPSTFGSVTGNGGGGGGGSSSWRNGASGGCGGGGGTSSGTGAQGNQPARWLGANNSSASSNGGNGHSASQGGGGGGGLGGVGSPGTAGVGGDGGPPVVINGVSYGRGGGGRGSSSSGTQAAQTANTGNGGNAKVAGSGESGMSGIVIVRYPL